MVLRWIHVLVLSWICAGSMSIDPSSSQYMGCFKDSIIARTLTGTVIKEANLTIESCMTKCRAWKYTFAGMEYITECYCGDIINNNGASLNCYNRQATKCAGNQSEICGGVNGISVYRVCPIDKTDWACLSDCSCGNRGCVVPDPSCVGSCDAGWTGLANSCTTACPLGKFGPHCWFDCSSRCVDSRCDSRDGRCLAGCKDGLRGPYCTDTCPSWLYGDQCDQPCPGQCSNECYVPESTWCTCSPGRWNAPTCDKVCGDGCETDKCDGWIGCTACKSGFGSLPDCVPQLCDDNCANCNAGSCTTCKPGYYGEQCESSCLAANCFVCEKSSGACTQCAAGYFGGQCVGCPAGCTDEEACDQTTGNCQSCDVGKHGDKCDKLCHTECDGACAQSSGACMKCNIGYYGNDCISCPSGCTDAGCGQSMGNCVACDTGYYGDQCSTQCPSGCADGTGCVKSSGYCNAGCTAGYYGVKCDTPCSGSCTDGCDKTTGACNNCPDGNYGSNCDPCPTGCADNTGCEKSNGFCNGDCKVGYYGRQCSIDCPGGCVDGTGCDKVSGDCDAECEDGKYGIKCDKECPQNCDGNCEKTTGNCRLCKTGYYGDKCGMDCPSGCAANTGCNKDNGECNDGCIVGYYGAICSQGCPGGCKDRTGCVKSSGACNGECKVNYYGSRCDQGCPSGCVLNSGCEKDTGNCDGECVTRRYGSKCDLTCPTNCDGNCDKLTGYCNACNTKYYGNKCEASCPAGCVSGSGCTKDSGNCNGACVEGKYGNQCQTSCPSNCNGACAKDTGNCVECDSGYYGAKCGTSCPVNCDGSCDKSSGNCVLCKNRYYGNKCTIQCATGCPGNCRKNDGYCSSCSTGYYADKCDMRCAAGCVNPGSCNKNTGACSCKYGYFSTKCDRQCPSGCDDCDKGDGRCSKCKTGFYGETCELKCNNNCLGKLCDKGGGKCLSCIAGYHGDKCTTPCAEQCKDDVCDQDSARCTAGCNIGYYGDKCSTQCVTNCDDATGCQQGNGICNSCDRGYFGDTCQERCSNCLDDDCKQDGSCTRGCVTGKHGTMCDEECAESCLELKCQKTGGKCLGCEPGLHGDQCDRTCPSNCKSGFCTQNTAECDCAPGFYGSACDQDCPVTCGGNKACDKTTVECLYGCVAGQFGQLCDQTCPGQCDNDVCNRTSGQCDFSCSVGYHGAACAFTCPPGCAQSMCDKESGDCTIGCTDKQLWGEKCETGCSEQCVGETCKQSDGMCNTGCKAGYFGSHCNSTCPSHCKDDLCDREDGVCSQECDTNYYGEFCNMTCPANCNDNVCDWNHGTCTKGCSGGFYGEICESRCSDGCYGDVCDKQTGHCDGCKPGLVGDTCEQACPHPTFGLRCNSTCHCAEDAACVPVDGHCPVTGACQPGYTGAACAVVAPPNPPTAIVAGVLVPVLLILVVVIAIVVVFVIRRRRNSSTSKNQEEMSMLESPTPAVENTYTNGNLPPKVPAVSEPDRTDSTLIPSVVVADEAATLYENRKVAQPASVPLTVPQIGPHIDKLRAQPDGFRKEFTTLAKGKIAPWDVGSQPVMKNKNRYKNILPYDHNRVLLPTLEGEKHSHYINASYMPGFQREKEFIASQGPTEHMIDDFVRMVWELRLPAIVMVTTLAEDMKIKCIQYWPDKGTAVFGDTHITLDDETVLHDYAERTLTFTRNGRSHSVRQFHYLTWRDMKVPSTASPLLNMRARVLEAMEGSDKPTLVHCSAGVGRTGTYIALDYQLRQAAAEGSINVPECVNKLRQSRIDMVQTVLQYEFLYQALYEGLTLGSTIYTIKDFKALHGSREFHKELVAQYEQLEKAREEPDEKELLVARRKVNKVKNRAQNILPVSTYRAMLMTPVKGHNDYINAVSVQGYGSSRFYVTQLPLPGTVVDFWRLVYDYKCPAVLALTPEDQVDVAWLPASPSSPLRLPCFWVTSLPPAAPGYTQLNICEPPPETPEEDQPEEDLYQNVAPGGTIKAAAPESQESEYMNVGEATSAGKPAPPPGRLLHSVRLLPASAASPASVMDAFSRLQQHGGSGGPAVLVCFNGASDCGVFAASAWCLSQLRAEGRVDVFDAVRQTRRARHQLVTSQEQYKLIHEVVHEYITTHKL